MKKHIYDEKNGLWYTLHGDYYLPNIMMPEKHGHYGKYGRLRLRYLMEEKEYYYISLLCRDSLDAHLAEIDHEASEMVESLAEKMAKEQGLSEQMKAHEQIKWVGLMNNIICAAEEIVMSELIYV